ncbi:putative alpha/Beta hydrolase [Helianthus anomalus]
MPSLSPTSSGYGESDPFPKRSLKSEASDIQELADQLQLGSKFYIIGVSAGSCPTWSCVKDIPHRCHWRCKYNICEKTVKELLLIKIIYWLRERGAKLSYRFIVLSVLLPNLKRVWG